MVESVDIGEDFEGGVGMEKGLVVDGALISLDGSDDEEYDSGDGDGVGLFDSKGKETKG